MQSLLFEPKQKIDSPQLEKGQVHLWWLPLDIDDSLLDRFRSFFSEKQLLSKKQCEKLERLPSQQKQHRYIAGRAYLYQFLEHYLPPDASKTLQFGEQGKPSLKDQSLGLNFNFTDTCGYGLFAFSIDGEVGIDVENINRQGNFEQIAKRRFAIEEQQQLDLITEKQDKHDAVQFLAEQFLRCWTRKEAYGKAIGCGLHYPLRDHLMCLNLSQENFGVKGADQHMKQGCYSELTKSKSDVKSWQGQQFSIEQGDDKFIACLFSEGNKVKILKTFQLFQHI